MCRRRRRRTHLRKGKKAIFRRRPPHGRTDGRTRDAEGTEETAFVRQDNCGVISTLPPSPSPSLTPPTIDSLDGVLDRNEYKCREEQLEKDASCCCAEEEEGMEIRNDPIFPPAVLPFEQLHPPPSNRGAERTNSGRAD